VLRFVYGAFGRLESLGLYADALSTSALGTRNFGYDRAGNQTSEETRGADFTLVRRVARTFDTQRNLVTQANAQGGTRTNVYKDNLLWQATDEAGNLTRFTHDAFGRLRQVNAPLGALTTYAWDGHDNLVSVTDGNNNTTGYSFDGLGNLTAVTSKDTGTTHYRRDVDGQVLEQYDDESIARNEFVETVYDTLRRPIEVRRRKDIAPGQPLQRDTLTRFYWDDASRAAIGRVWRVEDYLADGGVQQRTLSYDSAGRLASERHVRPGVSVPFVFDYGYETGGALNQVSFPPQLPGANAQPTVLDLTRGPDDEVSGLTFGNVPLATSIEHHPFGLGLKSVVRGAQNFIRTEYALNLDGQRTGVRTNAPVSLDYALDARGLVQNVTQTGDVPRFNTFGHDALGRLTSAEYRTALNALPPVMGETYSYDSAGNRLLKTRPGDGKLFISVFDWKGSPVEKVPDNNLLRAVLDPVLDGGCLPPADDDGHFEGDGCEKHDGRHGGAKPGYGYGHRRGEDGSADGGAGTCVAPERLSKKELARLEAGWRALLADAKDMLDNLPHFTEAQLKARISGWFDTLSAWLAEFKLSGQTLMMLLFSSETGRLDFVELFNAYIDRRSAGEPMGRADYLLLKKMLQLAQKVPVQEAVFADPNWYYRYNLAGAVTEVKLETPAQGPLGPLKPIETFFCYRLDAQRRLVKVEWTTRLATLLGEPPPSPCDTGANLRVMAEYAYDSRNLRTFSNVMGRQTHYLFSPEGQLLAEATPGGALQKQYLYLDGEPFALVVLTPGISTPLPRLPRGCSSSGGGADEALFALAALAVLLLAGRRRSRVGLLGVFLVLMLVVPACTFDGGFLPPTKGKKRLVGGDLKDPTYFFHNDRLGTPVRMTAENGVTVWRAEYKPFGDALRIEQEVDGDGVLVENALRFPGQFDEALSSFLFQDGPYQNHHRWYSPDLGRYLSSEPLLMQPSYPAFMSARGMSTPAYAYARNDPTRYIDRDGFLPMDGAVTDRYVDSQVQNLIKWKDWHYSRNQYNVTPDYATAKKEWERLSDAKSIYHRHGRGNERNEKFVSRDGHCEAVYKDGQLVTDPANLGTYNFTGPDNPLGHWWDDVLPYWWWGNSPDDPVWFPNRIYPLFE
jgi:RHS repeat-associated protein/MYXO-CTERM domain-containing protein